MQAVLIDADEQIIGIKACVFSNETIKTVETFFCNFQFIVGLRNESVTELGQKRSFIIQEEGAFLN